MLQLVSFALLSSCKIFRIVINNINVIKSSGTVPDYFVVISSSNVPDYFVGFYPDLDVFFPHIVMHKSPIQKFHEHPSSGSRVIA
jgi:hypothetical protein